MSKKPKKSSEIDKNFIRQYFELCLSVSIVFAKRDMILILVFKNLILIMP